MPGPCTKNADVALALLRSSLEVQTSHSPGVTRKCANTFQDMHMRDTHLGTQVCTILRQRIPGINMMMTEDPEVITSIHIRMAGSSETILDLYIPIAVDHKA